MSDWEEHGSGRGSTSVLPESKEKTKRPPLFKVLLHNDDYTTQEFVVYILQQIFHKNPVDAYNIMMNVHRQGVGVAGIYPHEVAEAKIQKTESLARAREYPLRCSMEEE